jgi:hypothetical protein
MEWYLSRLDRVMDFVTFGLWEQIRGEVTWNEIKIKGER